MDNNNFASQIWKERRVPAGVLTDAFVMRFDKFVDWSLLSKYYAKDMPIDMIRTYQHRLVWNSLLKIRQFSEEFLREMYPNFDAASWQVISKHQRLSEPFISSFSSDVDWVLIKKYQKVSPQFLETYKDKFQPEEGEIVEGDQDSMK